MIPNHMKVNKTNNTPSKGLIDAILNKCSPSLEKNDDLAFNYCYADGLFVTVQWRGFPFARFFKRWYCITVDRVGRSPAADYLLVQYHDFTRVYYPGDWENVFREV